MDPRLIKYEGTRVEALAKLIDNPAPILKKFGLHWVRVSQRAFREQGRGRFRWDERINPNIPGILADLKAQVAKFPAQRFESRPALMDTGELKKSLTFNFLSQRTIEVGTAVKYANLHQHGGDITIPITRAMKTHLWELMKIEANRRARVDTKPPRREKKSFGARLGAKLGKIRKRINKTLGRKTKRPKKSAEEKTLAREAAAMRRDERLRRASNIQERRKAHLGILQGQLGFLFGLDEWNQHVTARPFVLFLDEDKAEMNRIAQAEFKRLDK